MKSKFAFDQLDTRLFKAFKAAADTLNFTHAAKLAAMTQSGMSQQISKLEEQLGSPLFKRLPKSMQLTPTGRILLRFIEQYNDQVNSLFEHVSDEQVGLSGRISYAMPNSCLASPHLQKLLKRRAEEAKRLILDIEIIPNQIIFKKILAGQIDFGFATEKPTHPLIESDLFCEEEYVLISKSIFGANLTPENLLQAEFIAFPGMDAYFDTWARKHFPGQKNLRFENLKIMATISTLEGAFKLLAGGVGWAVIPQHAVRSELESATLHIYGDKTKVAKNAIYIATLKGLKQPKRVQAVIDWFMEMVH